MTTTVGDVVEQTTAEKVLHRLDEAHKADHLEARRGTVLPSERAPKPPETTISIVEMSGDDVGELFGALAEAQGEFGPIERTLTAKIASKREGGANYSYSYAPLSEVLAAVRPALSKHGIAVMQFPLTRAGQQATSMAVRTMLGHKSGQWFRNDLVVSCVSLAPQDIGSAISYARRYALMAILGIAPDHDDDGAVASGRDAQITRKVPAPEPSAGPERVKIATVREGKRDGRQVWQIKTSAGEAWTEDATLAAAARQLLAAEQAVGVVTEVRPGKDGRKYAWLTELLP